MVKRRITVWMYVLAILMVGVMAVPAAAQSQSSSSKPPRANHTFTIDGTATLIGSWTCGGDANVQAIPDRSFEIVPGLGVGVQMVTVTAAVPAIDCGDLTMNKHLRKALKNPKYPEIRFKALKYTLVDNGTGVQTSGELTIAGVTKLVDLGAKLIALPDGGARIVGKVQINMRDYGITPPSEFLGTLNVGDDVIVRFDTVVKLSQ